MKLNAFQTALLVLQLTGLFLLSLLLFTLKVANVTQRHPIFINFLITWVLYSAYTSFFILAVITINPIEAALSKALQTIMDTQLGIFLLLPLVGTMNLVIHLWITMWSALTPNSARWDKWLTPILLGSPYLISLVSMLRLWSIPNSSLAVQYMALVIMTLTSIWDILLLIMFFSHHRLVRHAVHHSLVPLSLLIKLGIFSVFRLGFCGLTIADGVLRSREGPFHQSVASAHIANAVLIGDCLYPLAVFALFGLHRELLCLWIPCLTRRVFTGTSAIDTTIFSTHIYDYPTPQESRGVVFTIDRDKSNMIELRELESQHV